MNKYTPAQLSALNKYHKTKEYLLSICGNIKSLKINDFSEITDLKKYIDAHFKAIESSEPLSKVFKVHYLRLYELRQHFLKIENNAKQSK